VVDQRPNADAPINANVLTAVDAETVIEEIVGAVLALDNR
jgi:hypothetical protein